MTLDGGKDGVVPMVRFACDVPGAKSDDDPWSSRVSIEIEEEEEEDDDDEDEGEEDDDTLGDEETTGLTAGGGGGVSGGGSGGRGLSLRGLEPTFAPNREMEKRRVSDPTGERSFRAPPPEAWTSSRRSSSFSSPRPPPAEVWTSPSRSRFGGGSDLPPPEPSRKSDRGLRWWDFFLRWCQRSPLSLVLAVAFFIICLAFGVALAFFPASSSPPSAAAAGVAPPEEAAAGVAGGDEGEGGGGVDAVDAGAPAPLSPPDRGGNRFEALLERIVMSGASSPGDLNSPGTPQNRALKWLAFDDDRHLAPEDEHLAGRYGLAVLFFATCGDDGEEVGGEEEEKRRNSYRDGGDDDVNGGGGGRGHRREQATMSEWTKSDGWLTEVGVCSWHGVRCGKLTHPVEHSHAVSHQQRADVAQREHPEGGMVHGGDGPVTHLVLPRNNLHGPIPPEIFAALPELISLNLGGNVLGGTLPSVELSDATKIEALMLHNNRLGGTVPDSLGGMTSLAHLDLSENVFSGTIPGAALGRLSETLVSLSLFGNDFTGTIPGPDLGSMASLTTLYLGSNKLRGSIPQELGDMEVLADLRLRDNALTGTLPDDLGRLAELQVLQLDENELTGKLPSVLGGLSNLWEVDLSSNKLFGPLPNSWSGMSSLKHLFLGGNGAALGGTLPPSWGTALTKLERLRLSGNGVKGSIPPEVGSAISLIELRLDDNKLGGMVPAHLGQLARLEELRLEGNALTGTMAKEVCDLRTGGTLEVLTVHCPKKGERAETEQTIECEVPDCCSECR